MDKEYFNERGISVLETEMTEVLRQGNNLILHNAKQIRELLAYEQRNKLQFQFDEDSFVKTDGIDVVSKYAECFSDPEIGNGIVISYSNAQCYHYNIAIRERIFPDQTYAVPGDLLLINNNNYHTYGAELFNGDIAKVISVDPEIITQSAPVLCDVNGVKVRKNINLNFRKIVIRIPSHPDEINCYIIDSLLHSINRDLTICEMKSLYINFVIRFNEEQNRRKEAGVKFFKVGSDEFKQALKNDPFFNALKVKFGYAITCHKAQGGEWDKVFVDYHGRVSLNTDPLRWCYTATTRGVNTVFAINAPQFGKLDKFKLATIGTIATLPNESLALDSIPISPFHKALDHKCKSLKYWEIVEKLENTDYRIKS
ncbi:MAG: ATP-binding domain-containing protein [Bacteroidetes bacterium]|nr:ATP-binding domain-containing protein [Bacteroidota bacterium]